VFLPGTKMEPRLHELVLQMGAYAGYRTIGLSYDNRTDPGIDCADRDDCKRCSGPEREEMVTGQDESAYLNILAGDSIISRLRQLLLTLRDDDLRDGSNDDQWDSYLGPINKIVWSRIIVAGFSQGAGHAAYIAQRFGANALVMLDGGDDRCGAGVIADWYEELPTTPKYYVGHCRTTSISTCSDRPVPMSLLGLGFPDASYVIEEGRGSFPFPRVTMTIQAVVTEDPEGADALPEGKHCSEHFSMARDGCMPSTVQEGAAAASVPEVYLFPSYLMRFCRACSGPECPLSQTQ
jgi:hypothetical protein